jgi:acid stress chaperone HdeA
MLKRIGTVVAACAAGAALFTGCSGAKGGDTTCKDFNAMNTDDQKAAVEKMLKDQGKNPSNLEITGTQISAVGFCKTLGKPDSKISDINHG